MLAGNSDLKRQQALAEIYKEGPLPDTMRDLLAPFLAVGGVDVAAGPGAETPAVDASGPQAREAGAAPPEAAAGHAEKSEAAIDAEQAPQLAPTPNQTGSPPEQGGRDRLSRGGENG